MRSQSSMWLALALITAALLPMSATAADVQEFVVTDLPPLNSTTSRERIWGWSKPREATNATRKEGTG